MEEARVEGGDLGGPPVRRSAADALAVVTATQRLTHNALIVRSTPHPCLFYCRNDHTGPPEGAIPIVIRDLFQRRATACVRDCAKLICR
jgi:hypothetical protein